MRLGDDSINWVESIKYLGVNIVGGKKLSFDIQALRRSFCAAFNNICSSTKTLEEVVQLTLHAFNEFMFAIADICCWGCFI